MNLKQKHDEIVLRCAVAHVADVGMQNLTDREVINKTILSIKEEERSQAGGPVIGAGFQIAILEAAHDIAVSLTPAELFVWVRNNLEFSGTKDEVQLSNNAACPKCGAELPACPELNYCPVCGQRVELLFCCDDEEDEE